MVFEKSILADMLHILKRFLVLSETVLYPNEMELFKDMHYYLYCIQKHDN